jgi:hypothetical protein
MILNFILIVNCMIQKGISNFKTIDIFIIYCIYLSFKLFGTILFYFNILILFFIALVLNLLIK